MTEEEDKKKVFPFHEMGLDDRILKAIAKLGWVEPTLIQERAVPLIMEGKDLLARCNIICSSIKTQTYSPPHSEVEQGREKPEPSVFLLSSGFSR